MKSNTKLEKWFLISVALYASLAVAVGVGQIAVIMYFVPGWIETLDYLVKSL